MQGWQPASILNAREGHTANLLHSGRVLVHGGLEVVIPPGDPGSPPPGEQITYLRTADLYHPDTNEWIVTGSTAIARSWHTATLLPNGSVLVVGGANARFHGIKETEIYDPSTQAWSFTGALNFARWQHAATPLQDGRVLVAGGMIGDGAVFLSSAEIFNPAAQEWTDAGNLSNPRYAHTLTLLSDGRVLLVGGFKVSPATFFSAEIFNPSTVPAWTNAEHLLSGSRWGHTATRLSDGKVLVAGGARVDDPEVPLASCEIFDPVTGHWNITGNLNEPRFGHTATLLPTGIVMVVQGGPLHTTELFNPAEGWTLGPDMSIKRGGASQTLLRWDRHKPLEFKVLVAGGHGAPSTNTLDSAELFTSGEANV